MTSIVDGPLTRAIRDVLERVLLNEPQQVAEILERLSAVLCERSDGEIVMGFDLGLLESRLAALAAEHERLRTALDACTAIEGLQRQVDELRCAVGILRSPAPERPGDYVTHCPTRGES